MTITAAVITFNEERNIAECLESVKWADEIILVDSGSTDRTLEIAWNYTEKVFHKKFTDFAAQKNEALARATKDWVLVLDADERVTPELAAEIRAAADSGPAAYEVGRDTYFFGSPLRFSGTQDDFPTRLFPRGAARYEQPVHEVVVTSLPLKRLRGRLAHYSTRDFEHYRRKLRQYVSLELQTMKKKGRKPSFLKLLFQPPARFVSLYILKLGVLDGLPGLQYALLSATYAFMKQRNFILQERFHAGAA